MRRSVVLPKKPRFAGPILFGNMLASGQQQGADTWEMGRSHEVKRLASVIASR